MPPRDETEYELRRNQIIDGALKVFAAKGFERATNKDIAAAAGIGSPGLIYHYFADKADLLHKVVERHLPLMSVIAQPDMFNSLPLRQALTLFGHAFLSVLNDPQKVAAYKIILSEAVRHPTLGELVSAIGPRRGLVFLTRYLEQAMARGELRQVDTRVAVRAFVGPLIAYAVTREVFMTPDAADLSLDEMLETAVDIFLRGMEHR